jgi:hypothetical protein
MKATTKVEKPAIGPNWTYFKLELKLQTDMLGTCCEASIYNEHVLQKAKKEIAKANKLTGKLEKSLQKYQGSEISFEKELLELKAVIRAYQAHVGRRDELPDDIDELLEYAKELEAEYAELVSAGETAKATVFMKDKDNWPIISTHMVLGNIKENLKIITNNGDKSIVTSKVSCGEIGALDVKAVEAFMRPDLDIKRDAKGKPVLEERPIMFERMGKKLTAIAQSEVLPAGAEMVCTLRVRKDSPITQDALWKLLDLGKSNGLGTWRGSGNRGAFVFRLTALPDFREPVPEGWN